MRDIAIALAVSFGLATPTCAGSLMEEQVTAADAAKIEEIFTLRNYSAVEVSRASISFGGETLDGETKRFDKTFKVDVTSQDGNTVLQWKIGAKSWTINSSTHGVPIGLDTESVRIKGLQDGLLIWFHYGPEKPLCKKQIDGLFKSLVDIQLFENGSYALDGVAIGKYCTVEEFSLSGTAQRLSNY